MQSPYNKVKIVIIGVGPAGISAAFYLRRKNYDVTIFDENKKIGEEKENIYYDLDYLKNRINRKNGKSYCNSSI